MSPDQADLFDRLAAGGVLYEYKPEDLRKVSALVASKGHTLEVGCGDGAMGAALEGADVVAFDISPECARLAHGRGLRALVGDAVGGFPFADAAFDAVLCADVLHHLHGAWDAVFAEMDRVLRPGGTIVVMEPDARNTFVRWTQAPRSPIRVAPYRDEPAIFPDELDALLASMRYDRECRPIHIEAEQVERGVFPLWQRVMKAPFVIALAWWCRGVPNKFAIVAHKPEG
ncbi:MAG: class I SAM-dependent methyltransferase [bacterium]|nr:class I SAM-dependent methyltransferase [bacterium]